MTDQNQPIITPEEERARLSRYPALDRAVAAAKRHPLVTAGIGCLLFVLLAKVRNISNDADSGLVLMPLLLLFAGGIGTLCYFAVLLHQRRREAESAIQKVAQSQLDEGSQVIIKTYEGSQAEAILRFQADANMMAAKGYFPTAQSWAPGQWSSGAFLMALLLCFVLIGIIALIYMLIVKPDGTLTVTYELRAASVQEKTCPKCAERIKAAALVCHFCGHKFAPGN